jgi:hypothetical protein
MMRREEALTV